MRRLILAVILLLLTSCGTQPDIPEPTPPQQESTQTESPETAAESAEPETEAAETEPETVVTEHEPQPAATETVPAETAEPPEREPVPLNLPDGITTNITVTAAEEILTKIAGAFADYPDAAVYFADVNGQFFFGIHENVKFHSASTIKAPYCLYLSESGTDLSAEIPFLSSSRTSASGMLTTSTVGQSFTADELIGYTIRDSDNQAYRLLYDTFGTDGYNEYITSIGIPGLALDSGSEWAEVSARELSAAMSEIYRSSETLAEHLKNTSFNAQISAGTAYETAHKYGYNGSSDGYHDTAIVYAPGTAYVLTVMTYMDFAVEKDANALFRTTAEMCDDLHAVLFGDAEE